jgi:hypothetical protein
MSGAALLALIKSEWRPLLGMALVTAAFCGVLYVKGLRADNARLRQAGQVSEAVIDRLEADLWANRKALAEREIESRRLADERQAAVAELEKVYSTDQEACDWSSGTVPSSVYDLLCQAPPKGEAP